MFDDVSGQNYVQIFVLWRPLTFVTAWRVYFTHLLNNGGQFQAELHDVVF